jgi:hypothetical protein
MNCPTRNQCRSELHVLHELHSQKKNGNARGATNEKWPLALVYDVQVVQLATAQNRLARVAHASDANGNLERI